MAQTWPLVRETALLFAEAAEKLIPQAEAEARALAEKWGCPYEETITVKILRDARNWIVSQVGPRTRPSEGLPFLADLLTEEPHAALGGADSLLSGD